MAESPSPIDSAEEEALVNVVVSTPSGRLRGRRTHGVCEFRGITYASAQRFEPPVATAPWRGVRDAFEYGAICPQQSDGFEQVLGTRTDELRHDEDCLNLSVTTPAVDDGARPVIVWVHGGSYLNGSGSLAYFAAHKLVTEGDVVVVRINYRLGVFGFLRLEGVSPGNLGLRDQIAALEWVHRNIASFGGDPKNVTVIGQSAGADATACLMTAPGARGLFHRAVMQSGPFGIKDSSPAYATRTAKYFTRALAAAAPGADPRTAPVSQVLAAQVSAMGVAAVRDGLRSAMPFGPVAGDAVLPRDPRRVPTGETRVAGMDVIVGWTRDDVAPFVHSNVVVDTAMRLPRLDRAIGMVTAGLTRRIFSAPALELADRLTAAGARVYTYRFDWASPTSVFGACHCIDLPFLFGDEPQWRHAPMLEDASWAEIDDLGRRVRRAVATFARTGVPDVESGVWRPHAGSPSGSSPATSPLGLVSALGAGGGPPVPAQVRPSTAGFYWDRSAAS